MMSVRIPAVRAKSMALCSRVRALPVDGDVLVRLGDAVQPDDVVAEATIAGEPVVVSLAQDLGCSNGDVSRFMVKRPGDVVRKGELIAIKKGFLKIGGRACTAPIDGVMGASPSASGEVVINPLPGQVQLKAGMPGVVAELIPGRGAVIKVEAGSVQGIAGLGTEVSGKLKLAAPADEEILASAIDDTCQGAVLVGGSIGGDALARSQAVGVRGIVVGGVSGEAFAQCRKSAEPMPLIITEGFGVTWMSQAAYRVLESHEGHLAVLLPGQDAIDQRFLGGGGPLSAERGYWSGPLAEVVVPLDRSQLASAAASAVGSLGIRAVSRRGARVGQHGTVLGRSDGWSRLPSGAVARTWEVELEGGARAQVPRCNLESTG